MFVYKHTETIPWKFHNSNPKLFSRKVCEMFVYKHTETIEYVKKVAYFLGKIQN